ncbi:hypothetical protein BC941DRAFT_417435 [Chlamydoabsidia padenii]|nr:hypothetical protein BC941DRAFT_417435 [Chlamydoabsidia padenii]
MTQQQQQQHYSARNNQSSSSMTCLPRHTHQDQPTSNQQSTSISRGRWSTWSSPISWISSSRRKRKSHQQPTISATMISATRRPRHRHSWLDQHKRRTYPPRAMRVLKQEQKRLTQTKKGKIYRLVDTINNSNSTSIGDTASKKQRDAFFHPVRRRRHSLTGVLCSFVHSTSSLSPPSSDQSGAQSSSNGSSSSRLRRLLQRTPSSSRKSTRANPTVRSSMVLQFTDDDDGSTSLHLPDVFSRGNNNSNSKSTLGSGTTSNHTGKSISSRRRQKQRLELPYHQQGSSSNHWFSNWILHHPRRRQRHRHQRRRHPVMAMNNNGSTSKIHPSPFNKNSPTPPNNSNNDDDNEKKDTIIELDKALPLLRHATLSDLSSLSQSSSNKSQSLVRPAAVNDRPRRPPTRQPSAYRFSVFWKSSSGKTGKQVIHVDERGQAGQATLCTKWITCNHDKSASVLAILFIVGFLICPMWWIGAALYLTKSSCFEQDLEVVYLWTPRTFGHLNCWMSAVSLLLIGLLAALAIWYHLEIV